MKVVTGAKREEVKKEGEDQLVLSVKEKAERGEANERVRELVAGYFGVPQSAVRIVSGRKRPNKLLKIKKEAV